MSTWVRRSVIGVGVIAVLVGLYALAGYYLVPKLVRDGATDWTQVELQKTLTMGEVAFDPFSLTLDISDLAIKDQDTVMASADHMRVNLGVTSLFGGTYHLHEFTFDAPYLNAILRADGSINLVELMPETDPDEPMPSVKIDRFAMNDGRIDFADLSRAQRPVKQLRPITFTLLDFQTDASEGGEFKFDAMSERGEVMAWQGTAAMAPVASAGQLRIDALQMSTVGEFFGEDLPVVLDNGSASLALTYDFAYGDDGLAFAADVNTIDLVDMALTGRPATFNGAMGFARAQTSINDILWREGGITARMPEIAIDQLRVSGPGEGVDDARIQIPQLQVANIQIDQPATTVTIDSFALVEPSLAVRREANGAISLMDMMPTAATAAASAPASPAGSDAAQPAAQPAAEPAPEWTIELAEARIDKAAITFEDRAVSPRARFNVTPVNLVLSNLSSDMTIPANVDLDARIDGRTAFNAAGSLTPATASANIDFQLRGLSVDQLRSYMPVTEGIEVRKAVMGVSGKVRVANGDATKARFNGRMSVNNLAVHDAASDALLMGWDRFALNGIAYAPGSLLAERGELVKPVGRIEILPDGTYNFTSATGIAPAPDEDGEEDAAEIVQDVVAANAPGAAGAQVAMVAGEATEEAVAQIAGTLEEEAANLAALNAELASAQADNAEVQSSMPDMDIRVKRLDISDGLFGFADFVIEPNFQADIQSLSGSITNITTNPDELTQVELEGFVVDRFSPATVSGTMDVFGYDRQTDMKVAFRNIELPVFNPYSGRYAGYAIARGKLSADFHYQIENRALDAEHQVTIDQLKWGEAAEGQERAPFPVRLASSLLKDKDGVIDLDVPVTGTLDDPSFRMGPIIWKIIGNVLEKAITAPFRLLGSIFAGAEDAKFVDFEPGSAQLPIDASESIAALASAMSEREELMLDIPAGRGIREDAIAIADDRIDALLLAKEIEKGKEADLASLSVDKRYDRLKRIYRDQTGTKPEPPDYKTQLEEGTIEAPMDGEEQLEGGNARKYLETNWMREELRASFMPSDAELDELGAARAVAVRDILLADGTVAPERVFSNTDLMVAAFEESARLELEIK